MVYCTRSDTFDLWRFVIMSKYAALFTIVLFSLSLGIAVADDSRSDESKRLDEATSVLEEIAKIPESGVPPSLLSDAYGVAVVPGVIKVGFVVGGRRGKGVVVVRGEDGAWSRPIFVSLTGGSVGWQIGAQSTDVVLVFKSKRSIEGVLDGKFTLGADASVAAGPVGRRAEASTDPKLKAEIYSYSRTRGLFAGVSFEGAKLGVDEDANADFYNTETLTPQGIIESKDLKTPDEAARFVAELTRQASPAR
jgi:lipid-binding SYLF domain-containing protein